jgi:hypothetical protein
MGAQAVGAQAVGAQAVGAQAVGAQAVGAKVGGSRGGGFLTHSPMQGRRLGEALGGQEEASRRKRARTRGAGGASGGRTRDPSEGRRARRAPR